MEKVFCEYGDHEVNANEIDLTLDSTVGYIICDDCMKEVENERVKRAGIWFRKHKTTSNN